MNMRKLKLSLDEREVTRSTPLIHAERGTVRGTLDGVADDSCLYV